MRLRPVKPAAFTERRPESFRLLFLQLRGKMAREQETFGERGGAPGSLSDKEVVYVSVI